MKNGRKNTPLLRIFASNAWMFDSHKSFEALMIVNELSTNRNALMHLEPWYDRFRNHILLLPIERVDEELSNIVQNNVNTSISDSLRFADKI